MEKSNRGFLGIGKYLADDTIVIKDDTLAKIQSNAEAPSSKKPQKLDKEKIQIPPLVWWIIGLVLFAWISDALDKPSTNHTTPDTNYSAPAERVEDQNQEETRPSTAVNKTLSRSEYRYCTFWHERLTYLDGLINKYSDQEIAGYNGLVEVMNEHCRKGDQYSVSDENAIQSELTTNSARLKQDASKLLEAIRAGKLDSDDQSESAPSNAPTIKNTSASFDCSLAKSSLEILICSDDELSSLDGKVGEIYNRIKEDAIDQNVRQSVLNEQKTFLKSRTENCPIPLQPTISSSESRTLINCLMSVYQHRFVALEAQMAAQRQTSGTSEDLDPETKNIITAGVRTMVTTLKNLGVSGVKTELNSCDQAQSLSQQNAIYCMSYDTAASTIIPVIDKANNFPETPEFESSRYMVRMKDRLSKLGITDATEQNNIIAGIETETSDVIKIIVDEVGLVGK